MNSGTRSVRREELLAHAQWVRRLALQLVGDPNAADDVVQDTWLAALDRPPESARTPLRAWLATVVRNFARRRVRGEVRRQDRERTRAREDAVSSESGLLAEVEEQRAVVQVVMELPDAQRDTILLRYYKELSAVEIARRQGVPAATVRSRLARGLEEVRVRMDERNGGDRAAWCALLLGESVAPPPLADLGASRWNQTNPAHGAGLAEGVVIMKTGVVLAAAVGSVALVVAGVAVLRQDTGSQAVIAGASPEAPPAPVEEQAVVPPTRSVAEDRTPAPQRDPVAATSRIEQPEPVAAPVEPSLEPAVVVARFVDPEGYAVPGVGVSVHRADGDWGSLATDRSGSDGRVRFEVPMREESEKPMLRYEAPDFVSGTASFVARPGETANAGTISLVNAVLVTGRVVDAGGNPVEGAYVFAREPELPNVPEGQLRRKGSDGFWTPEGERLLEVPADDSGAFRMLGEVDAVVRLWARKPGMRYGWTEPVELSNDVQRTGVEIVLTDLEPEDRIAGVALDAEGNPLANRYVSYRFGDEGFSVSTGLLADENGRFDLVLARRVPHTFSFEGDAKHPGTAVAGNVEPGTLDLVLALTEEGEIEIVVVDLEDRPVRNFVLETRSFFSENSSSSSSRRHETKAGRVRVSSPGGRFEFEVSASGYRTLTLGPFDGAAGIPTLIEFRLEPTVGVQGRVTLAGEPLAGVELTLHERVQPGLRYEYNGFPSRLVPYRVSEATSDADGRFKLDVSEDGTFVVRAVAEGHAAVESDPIDVVAARGYEGIELEPQPGGTLVVFVRVPDGADPAGVIVGITDGGPSPRTSRTDGSGEVVFENLRPGSWVVLERDEDLHGGQSSSSSWSPDVPYAIPWSCDVLPGETTVFELELEADEG